jgi:hypothetical protein
MKLEKLMPSISGRVSFALLVVFLSASFLSAQAPSAAPAAPLPTPILSAKKLFIANGGEQRNLSGDLYFSGGPDRAYNQFYASMKDWGRYEIVPAPADADLVIQIHLDDERGGFSELDLVVLDPKTHFTLWTLSEHAMAAGRQKTRDASFDRAISLLSDDLKKLVAGPSVAAAGVGKK